VNFFNRPQLIEIWLTNLYASELVSLTLKVALPKRWGAGISVSSYFRPGLPLIGAADLVWLYVLPRDSRLRLIHPAAITLKVCHRPESHVPSPTPVSLRRAGQNGYASSQPP
jgi:hypothetical protein